MNTIFVYDCISLLCLCNFFLGVILPIFEHYQDGTDSKDNFCSFFINFFSKCVHTNICNATQNRIFIIDNVDLSFIVYNVNSHFLNSYLIFHIL